MTTRRVPRIVVVGPSNCEHVVILLFRLLAWLLLLFAGHARFLLARVLLFDGFGDLDLPVLLVLKFIRAADNVCSHQTMCLTFIGDAIVKGYTWGLISQIILLLLFLVLIVPTSCFSVESAANFNGSITLHCLNLLLQLLLLPKFSDDAAQNVDEDGQGSSTSEQV